MHKSWVVSSLSDLACAIRLITYQVLGVEQISVDAKEGGNDYCIYLGVEQVYYT